MARKETNPKNPNSPLFKRLTRLLSGPIVNYRRQLPHRIRRRQADKYEPQFTSASGKQFKRSSYNPFENNQANVMANQNRVERYVDFDQMEYTPEIASALDIYADEMTTSSELQPLLSIKCPNEEIKSVLEVLYKNILNIEFNLFQWSRSMCKFGDFFLYIDIDDTHGVKSVVGLPVGEIERMEGEDHSNPAYLQYQWNTAGLTFENWQVAHFRVLGNDKFSPYGTSVCEPARRIWRQLTLLEDAVMAYRIVRSPERRVFYIDVGAIAPGDVEQYMQKVVTQMKRNQIVDPDTGRVDLRYNPMSVDEDYFIPIRGGTSSRVETLPGGAYTGDIDDVKYLRDKLFSALKVPMSYLSRGEGADEDKTTLAQKDIRFARTIQRLQRSVVSELEKIGIVHLFTLGFRGDDLISFKLSLNNPSRIAELQEIENWSTKFTVATAATEGFFSKRWIGEKIFGLSHDEFLRNQREMFHDRKFESALEAIAAAAAEAGALGGGDLGGFGDAFEGEGEEAMLGEPEEGGLPPDEGEGEGEPPPPEEGDLLAAPPGKRDEDWYKVKRRGDGKTTTSKSKGKWHTPVSKDLRPDGAARRSRRAQYSYETGKATRRNTHKGYSDILSLAKGIYEEAETNYINEDNIEENKLFEVNNEVRSLINELQEKSKDKNLESNEDESKIETQ